LNRSLTGLAMATLLLAGGATAVAAQSDTGTTDGQTVALTINFDTPALAGMAVTVDGSSTLVPDVSAEGDTVLHIQFPADVISGGQETTITVAPTDDEATVARVSANDASARGLVAALESAGVPAADRWAREIMEYRPYATDDPSLAELQDELAKYDPAPETLSAILNVLEP
jgi:hypothetical protein